MTDTDRKVSSIPPIPILYRDINNPDSPANACMFRKLLN
jgi:hypothetical protein